MGLTQISSFLWSVSTSQHCSRTITKTGHKLTDSPGDVVLNVHCANYYYPFAEASVQAGANVNFRDRDNGFSALYWAVTCANSALMTLLLDNGADVDIKTRKHAGALTPLHRAIDINHPVEAKILIERGANLTVRAGDGLTPLERARAIGSKEMKQIEEMLSRMTPAG